MSENRGQLSIDPSWRRFPIPIILVFLMLAGVPATASAASYEIRPPAGSFALLAPVQPPGRPPMLYGANASAAGWAIAQWDIPEPLPSFEAGLSHGKFGSVRILADGVYMLRQTTKNLPCNKIFESGKRLPDEFDLFVRAMRPLTLVDGRLGQAAPSLAEATQLQHSISVRLTEARTLDGVCQDTMINLLTAIVLTNHVSKQTLFYQISLARSRLQNRTFKPIRARPGWFRTGRSAQSGNRGSFGYDDTIWASYGQSPVSLGNPQHVTLNLLPQVKAVIVSGARYGMDQDLSHWHITGTYHGQNAFGHVDAASEWSDFSLVLTTAY